MSPHRRFARVAMAGIAFQAGSAAVDSATIMSALVLQLTGSPVLVGAVPAILRFGWLIPQLFVGFLASSGGSSMRYYVIGAFGRTSAIAALAAVLHAGAEWPSFRLGAAVMALWTVYAFVSGIVAVPYNDIVARAVPSERRSRLLATRFFGGGLLALGVAAIADRLITGMPFPESHAAVLAMAAALMLISSAVFTAMGDPAPETPAKPRTSFAAYFRRGLTVFREDRVFRLFVFAQWCGGAVLMAAPFYVVAAEEKGLPLDRVALLLAAQTVGAIASNVLWGWWGDRRGKSTLMLGVAWLRGLPPALVIVAGLGAVWQPGLAIFGIVFFLLGAISNGLTIAVIGLLMEISPAGERPAYSGYFNALTAPAYLLSLPAGAIIGWIGTTPIFALSLLAAVGQIWFLRSMPGTEAHRQT